MTILRRTVVHLRRQDWISVAIELVIVVVGVYLGVQAANWNERREYDSRSRVFTERLVDDLRVEAWNYELQVHYNEQVMANARRAADALAGRVPLSDEALLVAAYRATQFNGNVRRRATYDELVSTGEIGLIRDKTLRALAMDLYTQGIIDQVQTDGQTSEYRLAFRRALPWQLQHALAQACGDHVLYPGNYAGIATVLDYPCSTGLPDEAIAAGVAILRGDRQFQALLQLRIADIATSLADLTGFSVYVREPLRRLASEKASPSPARPAP